MVGIDFINNDIAEAMEPGGGGEEVAAHCRGMMVGRGFWWKWVGIDWDVIGFTKPLFLEMVGNLREESRERDEVAEFDNQLKEVVR